MKVSRRKLRKIILEYVLSESDKYKGLDTRQVNMQSVISTLKADQDKEDQAFVNRFTDDMDNQYAKLEDIEELRRELEAKIAQLKISKRNLVTKAKLKRELEKLKSDLLKAMQDPDIADQLMRLLDIPGLA